MTTREAQTTLIDFEGDTFEEQTEPKSLVKKKSDLSGGTTMWQARLVLSTLEPQSKWATELRGAIRRGDTRAADELLDLIYARNTGPGARPSEMTVRKSQPQSTVLPPSPHWQKLEVG